MNEPVPDSSCVGHTTAEVTTKAENQGVSINVITRANGDHVLVYHTVSARVSTSIHTSLNERELDQERRRALVEVDADIIGIERMSVRIAGEGSRSEIKQTLQGT